MSLTVSVEAVKADLQVGAEEAEKVIGQLAKIGVLDRADDAGNYRVIMENGRRLTEESAGIRN